MPATHLLDGAARDGTLLVVVQLRVFPKAGRVVVPQRLGVSKRLQQRVRLENLLRDPAAMATVKACVRVCVCACVHVCVCVRVRVRVRVHHALKTMGAVLAHLLELTWIALG